jgi:hypothetical protein
LASHIEVFFLDPDGNGSRMASVSKSWTAQPTTAIKPMPLDTAATTAALRRATHLRMFGGGSSIIEQISCA